MGLLSVFWPNGCTPSRRCFLLSVLFLASVSAGAKGTPEYAVKAAYLYNFARFVEWPPKAFAGPTGPLNLCVAGDTSISRALEFIVKDKFIEGHKLLVRNLSDRAPQKDCQALFIAGSDRSGISQMLADCRGVSLLTIVDSPEFLDDGGVISFVTSANRLRFLINLPAAQQAQLKISSKLLSLALSVHK